MGLWEKKVSTPHSGKGHCCKPKVDGSVRHPVAKARIAFRGLKFGWASVGPLGGPGRPVQVRVLPWAGTVRHTVAARPAKILGGRRAGPTNLCTRSIKHIPKWTPEKIVDFMEKVHKFTSAAEAKIFVVVFQGFTQLAGKGGLCLCDVRTVRSF